MKEQFREKKYTGNINVKNVVMNGKARKILNLVLDVKDMIGRKHKK